MDELQVANVMVLTQFCYRNHAPTQLYMRKATKVQQLVYLLEYEVKNL